MGHPGRRKVRLNDALKHSGAHSQRHLVTDRRSHRDDDAQQGEEGPHTDEVQRQGLGAG